MKRLHLVLGLMLTCSVAQALPTVFNPFTGKLDYVGVTSNTVTAGSTNYIQNRSTLQSGATFYVSSGTVKTLYTPSLEIQQGVGIVLDNANGPAFGGQSTIANNGVFSADINMFGDNISFISSSGAQFNVGSGVVNLQGTIATTLSPSLFVKTDGSGNLTTGSGGSGGGYNVEPATVTFKLNKGVTASTATISQVLVTSNTVLSGTTFYQNGPAYLSTSLGVTDVAGTSHNPSPGLIDIWKLNVSASDPLLSIGSNNQNNQFVFKDSVAPYFSSGMTVGSLNVGVIGDVIYDNNFGANQGINFYANVTGDIDIKTTFGGGDILIRPANVEALRASNTTGINATSSMTIVGAGGLLIKRAATTTPVGDFILNISSADRSVVFGIQNNGHVVSSGTVPTVGTCGTSPVIDGTDFAGTITVGGGVVTACTVTFAVPFARAPICVCSDNSTTVACSNGTLSSTAYTINTSATLGGGILSYICAGNKG